MTNRALNFAATLFIVCITFYMILLGKKLLLPLVLAIVIWYIILMISRFIASRSYFNYHLPNPVAILISIIFTFSFFYTLFYILGTSLYNIVGDAPVYQKKLYELIKFVDHYTKVDVRPEVLLKDLDLKQVFTEATLFLTSILQNLILIVIYVLFLLLESYSFDTKIRSLVKNKTQYNKVSEILENIKLNISYYLTVKTFISAMTGLASYVVLLTFKVEHAEFWGIMFFLLNYIPILGSVLAVCLTLIVVSVQFSSFFTLLALAGLLTLTQIVMGNFLDPRLTGKTLNLSPIIIVLSVTLWGKIWGILGMFLGVPIMTIVQIIIAQFNSTRPIAVLLSANGKIPSRKKNNNL